MESKAANGLRKALDGSDVREVLEETFYRSEREAERSPRKKAKARSDKPDHYEVICISLYREDLERLDAKVADLKRRGHRKMSRSALIRFALDHAPLEKLPRSY